MTKIHRLRFNEKKEKETKNGINTSKKSNLHSALLFIVSQCK